MKELDLLKKDWKKNAASFEQISENEIYKMIHKRSSSVVKWIFIISILELGLGLVLGLALSFTKYDAKSVNIMKHLGIYGYYIAATVLLYAVILYFTFRKQINYVRLNCKSR